MYCTWTPCRNTCRPTLRSQRKNMTRHRASPSQMSRQTQRRARCLAKTKCIGLVQMSLCGPLADHPELKVQCGRHIIFSVGTFRGSSPRYSPRLRELKSSSSPCVGSVHGHLALISSAPDPCQNQLECSHPRAGFKLCASTDPEAVRAMPSARIVCDNAN